MTRARRSGGIGAAVRIVADDQWSTRHAEFDVNGIMAAVAVMLVRRAHDHVAMGDAIEVAPEFLGLLVDLPGDGGGGLHMAERRLDGNRAG